MRDIRNRILAAIRDMTDHGSPPPGTSAGAMLDSMRMHSAAR